MGKTVIVSEETVRDLLEAHASLSAWYYELWAGLRAANATARTPDDAARTAFVERLASDFPELAQVARTIKVPRLFVPAPPAFLGKSQAPPPLAPADEPATVIEPSQLRAREPTPAMASEAPAAAPAVAPPPMIAPGTVKYDP